jgi:hypothetical protein
MQLHIDQITRRLFAAVNCVAAVRNFISAPAGFRNRHRIILSARFYWWPVVEEQQG